MSDEFFFISCSLPHSLISGVQQKFLPGISLYFSNSGTIVSGSAVMITKSSSKYNENQKKIVFNKKTKRKKKK